MVSKHVYDTRALAHDTKQGPTSTGYTVKRKEVT